MEGNGESNFEGRGKRRGKGGPRERVSPWAGQKLFDRDPPRSIEAEMSLLGAMILDPRVIGDIIPIMKGPEDFYKEAHGHIYRAIVQIYDTKNSGDLVQITNLLEERGVFEQVGGGDYLVELANAVPSAVNAKHYATIVSEKAKLRRLIDASGQIIYDAYHTGDLGPEGAREVLDTAEAAIFEIAQESSSNEPQHLAELLEGDIQDNVRNALIGLQEMVKGELTGDDVTVVLLLPTDDAPLADRAAALGQWCQGFLSGFGLNCRDSSMLSTEATEVLQDLAAISQVQDALEESEDGETDYMEVMEYLRVAPLLLFSETKKADVPPAAKPSLH